MNDIQIAPYLKWFHNAKFGLFIHWGIYSLLGRDKAEWILYTEKIPIPEYNKLVSQFNPTGFDANEWVNLSKIAGMKYITFTTRHCDGFCMFDTKFTDFNSMYTPAKCDFVAELVKACHDSDIKICLYYCLWDWHHPDRIKLGGPRMFPPFKYVKGMLRELCTNYGKIDGIWFDVGHMSNAEAEKLGWNASELIEMIRTLQPNIIINDRTGLPGDYSTPEQWIPEAPVRDKDGELKLWEACMTINDHWGYHKDDHNHKPVSQLIHHLIDVVSKGGNFLLNVGPMPTGKIQSEFVERLYGIGAWMKVNGESIYGTTICPEIEFPYGQCTRKGNKIFLHILVWPGSGLKIHIRNEVMRVYLLRDKQKINFKKSEDILTLQLPKLILDSIDTVVVLELKNLKKLKYAN